MDALTERVLNEKVKILKAQLEIALKQRDGFAKNYHSVCKIPFQERREILSECDAEIEQVRQLSLPGFND
jgi:hypothetical protein